ncbi:hypothetical protein SK128_028341 [Halocaridina rubra]|uniref:Uncharacterized protein n=1 Tax=Halocaridina rubra TaxID=373956 RepID=A0AAN8ZZJ6_HALRR
MHRAQFEVSGTSLTNVSPDQKETVPLTKESLTKMLSSWLRPKTLEYAGQSKRDGESVFLHSPQSEPPDDWLQPEGHCSFTEILQDHFRHYISLPVSVISNLRGSTEVCDNLEVEKMSTDIRQHQELTPSWLKDAALVGECSWQLVKRKLDDNVVNPDVMEVSCLCDGYQCSEGGNFQCTPVTREVILWRSDPQQNYLLRPDRLQVTVGCLCAQRRGPEGNTIDQVQVD